VRTILFLILIGALALFSVFASRVTVDSDFPVFYRAAKTILDPNAPNAALYLPPNCAKYPTPEREDSPGAFLYSPAAAYLLAPLAFLPYYTAKAVMIFLDAIAYLVSVWILARHRGFAGRLFFYTLALSLLWLPFLQDIRSGQLNAVLLLLITGAACAANRNSFGVAGFLLGIATLFKLFPFAVALLLGLKNRRIIGSCAATLAATLLIPGSHDWFPAIGAIVKNYSPLYLFLFHHGVGWYYLFVMLVAGITAVTVRRCVFPDHFILLALAMPAILLVMPIIEYYHYIFLVLSLLPFMGSCNGLNWKQVPIVLISVGIVTLSCFTPQYVPHYFISTYLSNCLLLSVATLLWCVWMVLIWGKGRFPVAGSQGADKIVRCSD
jgi:hypothetical protein